MRTRHLTVFTMASVYALSVFGHGYCLRDLTTAGQAKGVPSSMVGAHHGSRRHADGGGAPQKGGGGSVNRDMGHVCTRLMGLGWVCTVVFTVWAITLSSLPCAPES